MTMTLFHKKTYSKLCQTEFDSCRPLVVLPASTPLQFPSLMHLFSPQKENTNSVMEFKSNRVMVTLFPWPSLVTIWFFSSQKLSSSLRNENPPISPPFLAPKTKRSPSPFKKPRREFDISTSFFRKPFGSY